MQGSLLVTIFRIAAASGNYIALLNNDAVADVNWLNSLVNSAQRSNKNTGMWASKILFL